MCVNLEDEVDPYKKPKDLLEVSPKGLVPGLKLHPYNPPRALNESTVILEYLEEYVSKLVQIPLGNSRLVQSGGVYHEAQPTSSLE